MAQANLTLRTLTPTVGTTKGSALTFEELDQNLKNLANVEVSADTTPQLGGNLDVNSNWITGDAKFDTSLTLDNNQDAVTLISVKNTDTNANAAAEVRFTSGADAFDFGFIHRAGDGFSQSYFTAIQPGDIAIGNFFGDIRFLLGGEFISSAGNFVVGTQSTDRLTVNNNGEVTVHSGNVSLASGKGVDFNGSLFTGGFGTLTSKNVTDYEETVYTGLSTSGTLSLDPANGGVQTVTITGNITLNAANQSAITSGQTVTVVVNNANAGVLTSDIKWAGADKTLSTDAGATDIITVANIGGVYYGSLAKGFA